MTEPADAIGSSPRAALQLTVVVPTFNERANVRTLVDRLDAALTGTSWEVMFVDDDSPDGTADLAKSIGLTDRRVRCIRRLGRRGLAGACLEGMLASSADCVAVIDGDLQHDETLLARMLQPVLNGTADLVIGTRYKEGGSNAEGFSQTRAAISRLSNRTANFLARIDVSDPMSGFFLIRRERIDALAPRLSTYGFKILLDILATANGSLRIVELPYVFRPRLAGTSKLDALNSMDFLGLVLAKSTRDVVSIRFLSFMLVGATGIIVHLAALKLALRGELAFLPAQSLATIVAMTSNFFLNNLFTYHDKRLSGLEVLPGLTKFYLICAVGAVSNVGVASWVAANEPVWWVAGLAGSLIGAIWNYGMTHSWIWSR